MPRSCPRSCPATSTSAARTSCPSCWPRSKDIPIKIVAPGTFVEGDPEKDFSAIIVAKDSDIRAPKDLEGKTLAVNTLKNVAEVTARASLEKQGVDTSKIELTEVDFPDMTAAVEQGRVDAAFAIEPFVTQATAGGNRIVDRPYVGTRPGLQIGCYFASEPLPGRERGRGEALPRGRGRDRGGDRGRPEGVPRVPAGGVRDPAARRRSRSCCPTGRRAAIPSPLELTAELMERYGVTSEKPDTSEALAE